MECAPIAAQLMARELDRDDAWAAKSVAEFEKTASGYIYQ
jgi:hypothetical protein